MEHDIGHSDTFIHIMICANGSQRYQEYLFTGELVPALNYWSKIALFSLRLPHIGLNSSSKPLLHKAIYILLRLDSISFVFVFVLQNQQPWTISSTMVFLFLNLHTVAIKLITPKKKKKFNLFDAGLRGSLRKLVGMGRRPIDANYNKQITLFPAVSTTGT